MNIRSMQIMPRRPTLGRGSGASTRGQVCQTPSKPGPIVVQMANGSDGGYDNGYATCDSFWGTEPGSLVRDRFDAQDYRGVRVLDLGCGEGKNAAHFARRGADVDAVECSSLALENARSLWDTATHDRITWHLADALDFAKSAEEPYDIVVMYGLLHCLTSEEDATSLVRTCQAITKDTGSNVVCTFNDRSHDLSAHPGFAPLLLSHQTYLDLYAADEWSLFATDSDLHETHPNNGIPHHHSMTRLIADRL